MRRLTACVFAFLAAIAVPAGAGELSSADAGVSGADKMLPPGCKEMKRLEQATSYERATCRSTVADVSDSGTSGVGYEPDARRPTARFGHWTK